MNFRRFWIALLCLPALIAPSGLSLVLCLCGNVTPSAARESCCAKVETRSCCDERTPNPEAPVTVRAPCAGCHGITTPDGSATRTSSGAEELGNQALLPLPRSFALASTVRALLDLGARPRAPHAPPGAAPIPLRI
ncbi:MAG: hypothetical protein K8S98_05555 [Planctomycetes bacterium]|nr:hypothetical protein [Planctomycetota bacterium]